MFFISHDILGKHEDGAVFATVKYQGMVRDILYDDNRHVGSGYINQTGRHSQYNGRLRDFRSSYHRRYFSARYLSISSIIYIKYLLLFESNNEK